MAWSVRGISKARSWLTAVSKRHSRPAVWHGAHAPCALVAVPAGYTLPRQPAHVSMMQLTAGCHLIVCVCSSTRRRSVRGRTTGATASAQVDSSSRRARRSVHVAVSYPCPPPKGLDPLRRSGKGWLYRAERAPSAAPACRFGSMCRLRCLAVHLQPLAMLADAPVKPSHM